MPNAFYVTAEAGDTILWFTDGVNAPVDVLHRCDANASAFDALAELLPRDGKPQRLWGVGHVGYFPGDESPWRVANYADDEDAARFEVWCSGTSWLAYSDDDGETWRDLDGDTVEVNEVQQAEDPYRKPDSIWPTVRRVSNERRPVAPEVDQ